MAHEYTQGSLFIFHPALNATPAGADTAVGYFSVRNDGAEDDRLLSVSAPDLAERVEIHTMSMDGGVMKMRQIEALDLPAGQNTQLSPEGTHLMFVGLKKAPAEGARIEGTLTFEKAGAVVVEFVVEPVGSLPEPGEHEHHH
jgi:copper(I)-binding protein